MWRRAFGIPAPPAWPVAEVFTLSLALSAARAADPGRLTPGLCLTGLVAVAVLCAATADLRPAAAVGVVAWLFDNGFVVHRAGDLRWDGVSDAKVLTLLVGCAVLTAVLANRLRETHD